MRSSPCLTRVSAATKLRSFKPLPRPVSLIFLSPLLLSRKLVPSLSPASEAGSSPPRDSLCVGGWAEEPLEYASLVEKGTANGALRSRATREGQLGPFTLPFPSVFRKSALHWLNQWWAFALRSLGRRLPGNPFLTLFLLNDLRPAADSSLSSPCFSLHVS